MLRKRKNNIPPQKKYLRNSNIYLYVCNDLHTQGRDNARQLNAGFFYAPFKICGSVPPCNSIMELLPLWCKSTGKAEPFIISACYLNFLKMIYTENKCANCTQEKPFITAQSIIDDILIWDHPENIRGLLRETLDAYFLFHDSPPKEDKEAVYHAHRVISEALTAMETLNKERAKQ
jgi:hypothetical protein